MVNIMEQYRPCYKASEHSKINRRPTPEEFATAQEYAVKKGLRVIR
jgi:uncharacterized Fe-S radical SAM superfamily protein PflX